MTYEAEYSGATDLPPDFVLPTTKDADLNRFFVPGIAALAEADVKKKHSHYFKYVSKLNHLDVYRVLSLFGVADPCLQHAIKKLLVAGGRGAKDLNKDVQEAIDTLVRFQEMRREEAHE